MEIEIEKEIGERVPGYRVILAEAEVRNSETTEVLAAEMDALAADIASRYEVSQINGRPAIAATRRAYKACGKDPNRYRPSQEQLMRRIVRGLGLYRVNTLVDAGNILSLETGCSVGFFDADKIEGELLKVGIGKEGEPYEGIGRGALNIAGLPIVRDAAGGIGTPTSDNERTKIDLGTTHLVVTVHLFDSGIDADAIVTRLEELLRRHASLTSFRSTVVS